MAFSINVLISSLKNSRVSRAMALKVAPSASGTRWLPRTATAFRFLEPMTVPSPLRPFMRPWAFMMPA